MIPSFPVKTWCCSLCHHHILLFFRRIARKPILPLGSCNPFNLRLNFQSVFYFMD